jgi:hypothetical protein
MELIVGNDRPWPPSTQLSWLLVSWYWVKPSRPPSVLSSCVDQLFSSVPSSQTKPPCMAYRRSSRQEALSAGPADSVCMFSWAA